MACKAESSGTAATQRDVPLAVMSMHLSKALRSLKRNRFDARVVTYKEDVVPMVRDLLRPGQTVSHGGSVTLEECGVMDLIRCGDYRYIPHGGATPEEALANDRAALTADTYLMSANAITEAGELYNVDGNGNRVAALTFGPGHVIVVAGCNKVVRDLDEAVMRMKTCTAPSNAMRLGCRTYCAQKGECVSLTEASSRLADGCSSPDRICSSYLVSSFQHVPNRITVILVMEPLGY